MFIDIVVIALYHAQFVKKVIDQFCVAFFAETLVSKGVILIKTRIAKRVMTQITPEGMVQTRQLVASLTDLLAILTNRTTIN